ncbi:F0F1 ATP synthase subunit B' [Rhodospirillaceae bacterium SYSU D60014]|uniref:F0F1 ATP synthase subunit B family protein n=1 Tax=Virgifigura deserti TaxID=2268457 RepID=UPI000E668CE9
MPQLNPEFFAPQLVWLAITFTILYFLMARIVLPRISGVLENREQRIQSDLEKAEKLKAEADEVLAAYNKAQADARAQAQAELQKAAAAIAAEAAKREEAFAATLAERGAEAEQRIAATKTAAMAELRTIATDVAGAVMTKLTDTKVPPAQIEAAVDSAIGARS